MEALGWYGPLIDLSDAPNHVGYFVQLLAFVHQLRPPQILRHSSGRELLKAIVLIGDKTHHYFEVSLWQRRAHCDISAGDIILMQNVKINKFRNNIMATTVQHSSVSKILQSRRLLSYNGMDENTETSHIGIFMKQKLKDLVKWAQATQSTLLMFLEKLHGHKDLDDITMDNQEVENVTLCCQRTERHFLSIAEFASTKESYIATFLGIIGEICLPRDSVNIDLSSFLRDWTFLSKDLLREQENEIAQSFICRGCKSCGFLVDTGDRSLPKTRWSPLPLICTSYVRNLHQIGWIYRPFFLHIWDQSANVLVLVKNVAAQQIMGNISAENIFKSLELFHTSTTTVGSENTDTNLQIGQSIRESSITNDYLSGWNQSNSFNLVKVFSVLVRTLLKRDVNSPFKFKVIAHPNENPHKVSLFELISFEMPSEA